MFTNPQRRRRDLGFSLVEIMVGLVIGMIGALVIYEVFAVSEAHKRTTTNINDAQFNGMVALLTIDRDARQAGYGYVSDGANTSVLGCNVLAYNLAATPTSINFRLAPILITDGGPGLPDTVTITYSTSSKLSVPVPMWQPVAGTPNYQVIKSSDRLGFEVGDTVLAAEGGKDCSLGVITSITGGNADVMNLTAGQNPYNKPGGLGVDYDPSAYLFNLGTPTIVQYSLTAAPNRSLVVSDLKSGAAGGADNTLALADNIVNMQAQYGIDTNGDGVVDSWQEPTGAMWAAGATTPSAANLLLIRAVRVGIVARSTLKEKATGPGGTCETTLAAPVLWENAPQAPVSLSADPDWQCYRYKVYQTVIPIRNMLWS